MIKNENQTVLMLGGNMGDTQSLFSKAVASVSLLIGRVIKESSLYSSAPWGASEQPDFLNKALVVSTTLSAVEVFKKTASIEKSLGKKQLYVNGPRTIDIDIIFYNDLIINSSELEIPHPRFHLRRFNLEPLNEIIADFNHPVLHTNISTLLQVCKDPLTVLKLPN